MDKYVETLRSFSEKINRAKLSGSERAMDEMTKQMEKIKYKFYKFQEESDQLGCERFYLDSK